MMKSKGILLSLIALFTIFAFVGCRNPTDPIDTSVPSVVSTIPVDLAEGVALDGVISAVFNKDMDPATIVAANFTVVNDVATAVAGAVGYDEATKTASFTPAADLVKGTQYTATLTSSVADLEGNTMEESYVWTFTTDPGDIIAPTVVSNIPADLATDVMINTVVSAIFSEEMDPATIAAASFTLNAGATAVAGTVSYDAPYKIARFTPAAMLGNEILYTATFTTTVADLEGNTLEEAYIWTFTTAPLDTTGPEVISTIPADLAANVGINSVISATFSEAMNHATIVAANFTVMNGATPVAGKVTYDLPNMTARFAPTVNLDVDTEYTATVSSVVSDISGNTMTSDKVWTFTTSAEGLGPSPVLLGTSGNFVILSKTGISTVPASVITGDIGVSPAAETYLTGFSQTKATGYSTSPQVTGFLYAADMTPPTPTMMTTAISDMETAFSDAAGRITPDFLNLGAGELSGLTLVPGLYKWASPVTISGNVTISGGANDVWIFQISDIFNVSGGVNVILSGGAQAKNIFWQVAGETAIGVAAHFEGVILCQTAVNFNTGASINGKILSQTHVALDQATVTDVQ